MLTVTSTDAIWQWLGEVTDPEIPVISVVDLGIIRNVAWSRDAVPECVVTITPTYSGCPAMQVIAEAVGLALTSHGVTRFRLETQLSPAWTTDWMSAAGKDKLRAYGIAPPVHVAGDYQVIDLSQLGRKADLMAVQCPNCGAHATRLRSQFGSTPCKALYVCDTCREPFDHFKSH